MADPVTPPPSDDFDDVPAATMASVLADAKRKLREGDSRGAVETVMAAISQGGVGLKDLTEVYLVLKAAERTDIAQQVRARMIMVLDEAETNPEISGAALLQFSEVRLGIDDPDGAERLAERAHHSAPNEPMALFALCLTTVKTGTYDVNRLRLGPVIAAVDNPVTQMASLVAMLGNFKRTDDALALLDIADGLCTAPDDVARLKTLRAGLLDEDPEIDQRAMATSIFDNFAAGYDDKLEKLGNNGPQMIAAGLGQLELAPDASRDIFDAGCGTGLCAPYLRPYARHLHGVDLSIPMLEKCRDKGTFDLLSRTDLAVRDTFPEGQFDMVVSGDVLVYFGALDTVFANLCDILRPGGRFIFTVEEAPETVHARGYGFTTSGRNHHSERYVREVLARSGFGPVDLMYRNTLRYEFGAPIAGLVVSACKPA